MIAATISTTPEDLSARQRRALDLMADGRRLRRVAGGYGVGPSRVSLAVADSLIARGLVRKDFAGGVAIVLTYSGKALQAVIAVRQERRAGL